MAGVEKRLHGIPGFLSQESLTIYLARYFRDVHKWTGAYSFEAIFDDSAEDVVSRLLFNNETDLNSKKTARLILPIPNAGIDLAGLLAGINAFYITVDNQQFNIIVEAIANPETPNAKFISLRDTAYPDIHIALPKRIPDWYLGSVTNVEYGNFDKDDEFLPDGNWTPPPAPALFNKFSVFFEEAPAKFQVCLQVAGQSSEYMNIHIDDNLRGVIFDASSTAQQAIVYFVMDKPPQFYQYNQQVPPPINDPVAIGKDFPVDVDYNAPFAGIKRIRIRYPTFNGARPRDIDVCNVPWEIQYSRVYKVTYVPTVADRFTFDTLKDTMESRKPRGSDLIMLSQVVANKQIASPTAGRLRLSLARIQTLPHGWRIAMLKLLYNCNVPIEGGINDVLQKLDERLNATVPAVTRANASRQKVADILEQSAHEMETCHIRTLRKYHALIAAANGLMTPNRLDGNLVEPQDAVARIASLPRYLDLQVAADGPPKFTTFKLMVYPSHLELYGPEIAPDSSITRRYHDKSDRFIRVRFLENDGNPFKFEPNVNPDLIIRERILNVLKQGQDHKMFPIPGFDFAFLGYSVSSLKKRKMVWFFRPHHLNIDNINADAIRNRIGVWNTNNALAKKLAGYPFKWGARIALAFTSSIEIQTLHRNQWTSQPDTPSTKPWSAWPNSDGCGIISATFCHAINAKMERLGYNASKAFQIRFGGVKGVVYTGAGLLFPNEAPGNIRVFLRDSNIKFNVPGAEAIPFQVVSTTGDFKQSVYFESLIQTLENLGAYPPAILQEFIDAYTALETPDHTTVNMLQQIVGMAEDDRDAELMSRHALLKLASTLQTRGVPFASFGAESFLTRYIKYLSSWALKKNVFAMPIKGSTSLLGLTDDLKILPGKRSKSDWNVPMVENRTSYQVIVISQGAFVEGDVLIFRDPIIHVGDLKIARALSQQAVRQLLDAKYGAAKGAIMIAALAAMDNVIYFSQEDRAPLPNLLSGGDLDGDRFEVIKKADCTFWDPANAPANAPRFNHRPSFDYAPLTIPDLPVVNDPNAPIKAANDFDVEDLMTFVSRYIRNDCFDELQAVLIALADSKTGGMLDLDVMAFSESISTAVDYAKGGIPANLQSLATDPRFKVTAKPSVLRSRNQVLRYDQSGDYYKSNKLIGQIYDAGDQASSNLSQALKQLKANTMNNNGISAAIGNIRNGIVLTVGNILNYINPIRQAIDPILDVELLTYRQYLMGRNITADAEMDVFMVKPRDAAFPGNFIDQITEHIKDQMAATGALQRLPANPGPRFGYAGVNAVDAETVFAQAAYVAWELALAKGTAPDPGNNFAAHYGVSYAYLCLYVCYCRKFNLD